MILALFSWLYRKTRWRWAWRAYWYFMRIAPIVLLLAVSLHAQDLYFNDTAVFPGQNGALGFSVSFEYNTQTQAILPGTMVYSIDDPFGLGPFTLANTSDGSSGWFNFTSPGAWIQIGDEVGSPSPWPAPGIYGQDTVLLCQSQSCLNQVDGAGYDPGYSTLGVSNAPVTAETPEPSTLILLAAGALLFLFVELARRL